MFPSKAFSMTELNINQILKLHYYKKLQKSGGQMKLMEIVLVLTCTQKVQ